jgi:hypothetical protein
VIDARREWEAALVAAGTLVKRSEREWLFLYVEDATRKAQEMADGTGLTYMVVRKHRGRYAKWYSIMSTCPDAKTEVLATIYPEEESR